MSAPARYELRADDAAFQTLRIEPNMQILFGRRAENTEPDVVVQVDPAPEPRPRNRSRTVDGARGAFRRT